MAVEEGVVRVRQIGIGDALVTVAVSTGWSRGRGCKPGSALGTAPGGATDA